MRKARRRRPGAPSLPTGTPPRHDGSQRKKRGRREGAVVATDRDPPRGRVALSAIVSAIAPSAQLELLVHVSYAPLRVAISSWCMRTMSSKSWRSVR